MGSSCGSKLNGKPVLRARLRAGDVVELGQSTLIFQLRRRKKTGVVDRLVGAVNDMMGNRRQQMPSKEGNK